MSRLAVSTGQYSTRGRKAVNQDFHGVQIPSGEQLRSKGIAVALADGISSSEVSQVASETAVRAFLEDYLCTSEAWSARKSAQRVVTATNSWLYAQNRRSQYRYDADRGYVCTLSALVLKSATAHLFHVGDARIYRLSGGSLEQLTRDHRLWISRDSSYLSRALGADDQVEIDYHSVSIGAGELFLLTTDGVHEFVSADGMREMLTHHADDLDAAARAIGDAAFDAGSDDNLTVQIVRVDQVDEPVAHELHDRVHDLALPPELEPRMLFDGYEIIRQVHVSSRSRVYLARDRDSAEVVALKTPSSDVREDPAALERFLMEEWIARRIDSPHVLKPRSRERPRRYLYVVMEFIEGRTLTQWMVDNPRPDIEQLRAIVEQIGVGLRAFHRQEMVHQDLRPDNVLIDESGTARIIDFGSVRVAGLEEGPGAIDPDTVPGTHQYSAPEYFLGERRTPRSDIFSLGVIAYQMLTGRLPYGAEVARTRTRGARHRLKYRSVLSYCWDCPLWIDGAIRKAVQPDPFKRYEEVSEFVYDLRHPRQSFLSDARPPLIERDPERFWKGLSLLLSLTVAGLLVVIALS